MPDFSSSVCAYICICVGKDGTVRNKALSAANIWFTWERVYFEGLPRTMGYAVMGFPPPPCHIFNFKFIWHICLSQPENDSPIPSGMMH